MACTGYIGRHLLRLGAHERESILIKTVLSWGAAHGQSTGVHRLLLFSCCSRRETEYPLQRYNIVFGINSDQIANYGKSESLPKAIRYRNKLPAHCSSPSVMDESDHTDFIPMIGASPVGFPRNEKGSGSKWR